MAVEKDLIEGRCQSDDRFLKALLQWFDLSLSGNLKGHCRLEHGTACSLSRLAVWCQGYNGVEKNYIVLHNVGGGVLCTYSRRIPKSPYPRSG